MGNSMTTRRKQSTTTYDEDKKHIRKKSWFGSSKRQKHQRPVFPRDPLSESTHHPAQQGTSAPRQSAKAASTGPMSLNTNLDDGHLSRVQDELIQEQQPKQNDVQIESTTRNEAAADVTRYHVTSRDASGHSKPPAEPGYWQPNAEETVTNLTKFTESAAEQEDLTRLIMSGAHIFEKNILHPVQTGKSIIQPTPTPTAQDSKSGSDKQYITFDHMTEQNFLYRMDNPRRGVALIFNIGEFLPVTRMKERNGYKVDGELMRGTFTKLLFDVHYHTNQTTLEMGGILREMSNSQHGENDCFVCVIMTHGNRTTTDLVFTKDGTMYLDSIIESFNGTNCPSLAGKPKLFFVQACRGDSMDEGVTYAGDLDETDSSSKKRKIPVDADILVSQATTPGYISFRNASKGSIYIRSLTKALSKHSQTEDILTVLTRVNAMVAFEFESNSSSHPEYSDKKQMPVFTSQLTKRLIFTTPANTSK